MGSQLDEILKKVKWIELHTKRMVSEVLSGQYKSRFKGQGMQFSEHRQYLPGDDVRHIDWKVSARTRDPMLKKYEEERELAVLLIVDVSGSNGFGSVQKLKSEMAAELAGLLAYAAIHSGDRVGLMLFASEIELMIPLRKGRTHLQRLIREVLAFKPRTRGTHLEKALESAHRILKHKGVVFMISDFMAPVVSDAEKSQKMIGSLKRLAKRHDVVALRLKDTREFELPKSSGPVFVRDLESDQFGLLALDSPKHRQWFEEVWSQEEKKWKQIFKEAQVETLHLNTQEDYGDAVAKFFRLRARR